MEPIDRGSDVGSNATPLLGAGGRRFSGLSTDSSEDRSRRGSTDSLLELPPTAAARSRAGSEKAPAASPAPRLSPGKEGSPAPPPQSAKRRAPTVAHAQEWDAHLHSAAYRSIFDPAANFRRHAISSRRVGQDADAAARRSPAPGAPRCATPDSAAAPGSAEGRRSRAGTGNSVMSFLWSSSTRRGSDASAVPPAAASSLAGESARSSPRPPADPRAGTPQRGSGAFPLPLSVPAGEPAASVEAEALPEQPAPPKSKTSFQPLPLSLGRPPADERSLAGGAPGQSRPSSSVAREAGASAAAAGAAASAAATSSPEAGRREVHFDNAIDGAGEVDAAASGSTLADGMLAADAHHPGDATAGLRIRRNSSAAAKAAAGGRGGGGGNGGGGRASLQRSMSFNGLTELQTEVITARVQAIRSQKAALAAAKQQAHQTAKFASVMALLLFEGVLCLGYLMYRAVACDPTLLDWQCSRKTFQDHYEHITQLLTIGGVLFATGPTVFAPILSAPALALLENFHNHGSRTALPPTLEGLKFKHAPTRAGVEMTTTGSGPSGGRRARTSSTAVSGNLLMAAAPVTLPAPSRSGGFALGSINGGGGAAAVGRGRLPTGVSLEDIDTPADTFVDVRDEDLEEEGGGSDADETASSSGEREGRAADGRVWCRRGQPHAAALEGRGEARTGGWCAPSSAEGSGAVFCRGRGRAGSNDAAAAGSLLRPRAPVNKLAASGISEPSAAGAAYFSSSPLVLLLVSLVVYGSSVIGFGALGQVPWMFNSLNSADSWRFPAIILYLGGFLLIAAMVGYSIWLTSYSRSELLITCIIILGIVFIYSSPFLMAAMLGVPSDTIVFHPHHYLMAAHVALLLRAPDPLVTVMRFVLFGVFTQGIAAYSPASMLSN